VMFGRWFHIAAVRSTNERGRIVRARSGATLPPTPLTEWHLTQPFEPNTRDPASGSWLGLSTGCAEAAAHDAASTATVRTVHLTLRIIGDPLESLSFPIGIGTMAVNSRRQCRYYP